MTAAREIRRPPGMPVAPWDMPPPAQAIHRMEVLGESAPPMRAKDPEKAERARIIDKAFTGTTTHSDAVYMARAIIQLCDEMAELRKRVSDLEATVKRRGEA